MRQVHVLLADMTKAESKVNCLTPKEARAKRNLTDPMLRPLAFTGQQQSTALVLQVSATSFNEGSSRSHTILRLSVESSERPDVEADFNCGVARTLSFLNLIDLAGSESAKAAVNRGHRTEGSYINKSLLTLGTVIAKLSDGNAAHIPFRDSKLTRLLQVTSSICACLPLSALPAPPPFGPRVPTVLMQLFHLLACEGLILCLKSQVQKVCPQTEYRPSRWCKPSLLASSRPFLPPTAVFVLAQARGLVIMSLLSTVAPSSVIISLLSLLALPVVLSAV